MGEPFRITTPKLETLEPRWRPYRGVSILYDNPGTELPPGAGPSQLTDIPVQSPRAQALFDRLDAFVRTLDLGAWRSSHGFAPLPRSTFHVTLCDGVNETQLPRLLPDAHRQVADFLPRLPRALQDPPPVLRPLLHSHLLPLVEQEPITFELQALVRRGHALLAELQPADAESRRRLERTRSARTQLADELQRLLGTRPQDWHPHITLGYFANQHLAGTVDRQLTTVAPRLLDMSDGRSIAFPSAALYGFTDAVTFYRS